MKHIRVHVYDDGDVELTSIEASAGHKIISNDLVFSPQQVETGELLKELRDYGFEDDRAIVAIADCLHAAPGEEIRV